MKTRSDILRSIATNSVLTSFERSVYRAILKIPSGEVRTYGWVAKAIGNPKASRAVGNALNKNPYSPVVPCHRVVRSDGSMGGFALGLMAKERLLKKEGIDLSASLGINAEQGRHGRPRRKC